jgi:hypothetical protein
MTCQELRCYLENPLRTDIYVYTETLAKAVSEHLASCEECTGFFGEQRSLGMGLILARDSAPQVPASLDATAIGNYRRQMMVGTCTKTMGRPRRFASAWLRWSLAAATAVIAIASAPLFENRKTTLTSVPTPAPLPAQLSSQVSAKQESMPAAPSNQSKHEQALAPGKRPHPERSVAKTGNPFPAGFASLMYCDELTCAGAMEVIRVQLLRDTDVAASNSTHSNISAVAEVLVGPDGVARGIRILQ